MSNSSLASTGQLQELKDEYERLGRPGEKIAKAILRVANTKWGKLRDGWMVNIESGQKVRAAKEEEVLTFVGEFFLHLSVFDPDTGEPLKEKKDQLKGIFIDVLAEPGKGINDFNNLIYKHMRWFVASRFKDTPIDRQVVRVRRILEEIDLVFGENSLLLGVYSKTGGYSPTGNNDIYEITTKAKRKHPPRPQPANTEEQRRWSPFWSSKELQKLILLILSEARHITGETDYVLTKDEWKEIFSELLTFTKSTTFSLSEETDSYKEEIDHMSPSGEVEVLNTDKHPPISAEEERVKKFLFELTEFELRLCCLKMACTDEAGKGKTDKELAVILGKTRQTISTRWKKIDSKIDEFFGKNSLEERRLLQEVIKRKGPFCEKENCRCQLEVGR